MCTFSDTSLETPPFYHYPQYLCLKLLRILVSCNLGIAVKLINLKLVDILENYLFNREDLKVKYTFDIINLQN